MKKLFFLFLLAPLFTIAQDKSPIVEGVSPGLYITHKVAPKENYYSVGRIYNISPKDIAPFNNLQLESGLSLGQVIKIPLNSSNFFQSGTASADETFVPVYYAVKGKEGLYRVALNHNDLPLETLKQWNNIKGDAVKNGTKLIIGYLKVKTELSGLAKNGIGTSIGSTVVTTVKSEEKKPTSAETVSVPVEKKEVVKPAVKESQKETVKSAAETVAAEPKKTSSSKSNSGTFKNQYESQVKKSETAEASGTAGVFKSSSGWTDKKYYCLHNSASQGTIIKITNPANGKFVFAKVLDLMPDIKQNEGLLIAISNAAADELGIAAGNFNCSINYSK
ncbi:MAG: LysM peptidoglycan-binding domain-containing protein [Ferruginibacter sp.]